MKRNTIIKIVLVLFLILAVYLISTVGIQNIWSKISSANPIFIFLALISILAMHITNAWRWHLFVRPKIIKPFKFFLVYLSGAFVTLVTPAAGIGGEPARAYYVSQVEKTSFTKQTSIAIIEKVLYGDILLIFPLTFTFLMSIALIRIPDEIKSAFFAVVTLIVLFFIALYSVKHNVIGIRKFIEKMLSYFYKIEFLNKRFESFNVFKKEIKKAISEFFLQTKQSITKRKLFIKAFSLGLLSWFFYYLSFYLVFSALGNHVRISAVIMAVTIARLIGFISFIPGGIGITESTLFGMFIALGINPVTGATVIIIQRGITYLYNLICGYLAFSYLGLKETLRKETRP